MVVQGRSHQDTDPCNDRVENGSGGSRAPVERARDSANSIAGNEGGSAPGNVVEVWHDLINWLYSIEHFAAWTGFFLSSVQGQHYLNRNLSCPQIRSRNILFSLMKYCLS